MSQYVFYLLLSALFALGVVLISLYTKTRIGYISIVLWGLCSMTSTVGVSFLMGVPKLVSTETRKIEVAQVLWSKVEPGKHIYLILTWKGLEQPLYYDMPWSKEFENDLSQAKSKSIARGTALMIRNPFGQNGKQGTMGDGQSGNSNNRSPGSGSQGTEGGNSENFYPAPPAAETAKDGPEEVAP